MRIRSTGLLTLALWGIAGCGGNVDRSCDDVRAYQLAEAGKRLQVPEDLDPLDELKEIPLPDASPQEGRAAGSPCLDLPPNILATE